MSLAWYTYVLCLVSVNTWLWMSQSSVAPALGQAAPSILGPWSGVSCLPHPSTFGVWEAELQDKMGAAADSLGGDVQKGAPALGEKGAPPTSLAPGVASPPCPTLGLRVGLEWRVQGCWDSTPYSPVPVPDPAPGMSPHAPASWGSYRMGTTRSWTSACAREFCSRPSWERRCGTFWGSPGGRQGAQ